MKAVNTGTLEDLAYNAAKRMYNRQLDMKKFEQIVDPDGVHLIQDVLLHEHKHGLACEPHARCQVYIKVKDSMEPTMAWLDIELGRFNELQDAPTPAELEELLAAVAAEEGTQ